MWPIREMWAPVDLSAELRVSVVSVVPSHAIRKGDRRVCAEIVAALAELQSPAPNGGEFGL